MAEDSLGRSGEHAADYEVGYGRPPRHARFSKGRSGNPKGRPRRSKNMATLVAKALNERVAVTENGCRRMVSKREVIVTQLVNRSAAADLKAMTMLLGMLGQIETAAPAEAPRTEGLADADLSVVQGLLARLANAGGAGEPERR